MKNLIFDIISTLRISKVIRSQGRTIFSHMVCGDSEVEILPFARTIIQSQFITT
jgi:hypothetical protein